MTSGTVRRFSQQLCVMISGRVVGIQVVPESCDAVKFTNVLELGSKHCRMLCLGIGRQSEVPDWVFWRSQSLPNEKLAQTLE